MTFTTLRNTFAAVALAGALVTSAVASPVAGPLATTTRVEAFDTDRFEAVRFRGQERATVRVSGDGTTDLDLFILDRNGQVVASDEDYTDECVVSFLPSRTDFYTIVVVNHGDIWNEYSLRAY
jgi:gamma-glutamyl:cysteine ligase YbdK (ATP-grasp superfamily)